MHTPAPGHIGHRPPSTDGYSPPRDLAGRDFGQQVRISALDTAVQDFSSTERKELAFVIDRAADASIALLANGLEAAQNAFHATP